MDIISQLLEKHNNNVPNELEKPTQSLEHCHTAQSQANINYTLSEKFKSFY